MSVELAHIASMLPQWFIQYKFFDACLALKLKKLCSLLSNVLDNAIHANCTVEADKRYIDLSIFFQGEAMILTVANPVEPGYTYVKSTDPTSMQRRGLGLVILSDIAELYDGWIKTECNNDVFKITVYINMPEIKITIPILAK